MTCLETGWGRHRAGVQRARAPQRYAFRPHTAIEVGASPGESGSLPAGGFRRAGFTPVAERGRAMPLARGLPGGQEG